MFARWWARRKYVWKIEIEATTQDLQADLSAQRAKERRDLAAQLRKEVETMEANVARIAEMEEKGFWLCENGHELPGPSTDQVAKANSEGVAAAPGSCPECRKPIKFIKRDQMSLQEKYESDKGRKEVETMIAEKRKLADQHETEAKGGDDTAKHFRRQAASSRDVADRLRKL